MTKSKFTKSLFLLGVPLVLLLSGCTETKPKPTEPPNQVEDVDESETHYIGVVYGEDLTFQEGKLSKEESKWLETVLVEPLQNFKEDLGLEKLFILEAENLSNKDGLVTGTLTGKQRQDDKEHILTIDLKDNEVNGYEVGVQLEEESVTGELTEFENVQYLTDDISYDSEKVSKEEVEIIKEHLLQTMLDFKADRNVDEIFIYEVDLEPNEDVTLHTGIVSSYAKKGLEVGFYNVLFNDNRVTGHATSILEEYEERDEE